MSGASVNEELSAPDWLTYSDVPLHPVLVAALAEFQQHGYHGTTVRGIAGRAGLTMPSLYYHFGSKEGILYALLAASLDDLELHIKTCLDAGSGTREKFENFVTSIALHYTHRHELAMLHHEARFLDEEFRGEYVVRRRAVEQALEELLTAGIDEGIFEDDDPHFTTRVLFGMLSGILDWYRTDGPLSPGEIAERYMRVALRLVTNGQTIKLLDSKP